MSGTLLLHVDADSFFAGVVMRHRPELASVPFAVVAHVFVASANYPARSRGVRGGMLVAEALVGCPELVLVDTPRDEVEDVSDALFDLFRDSGLVVEPGSMEEAFLDTGTADWGCAVGIAQSLRGRVTAELGITVSVGVGRTKLMAKLGSRAAKPNGLRIVGARREAGYRERLPIADLWGVGGRTRERLRLAGVERISDVDALSEHELTRVCGTMMARRLRSVRDGTDDATVNPVEGRTQLSSEGTISGFQRRDWTPTELTRSCVERVCHRAGRAGLRATGLTLTLRPREGAPLTAKHREATATGDAEAWASRALAMLGELDAPPLVGVRVTLTGLRGDDDPEQTLF